jgi:hypothetical protein
MVAPHAMRTVWLALLCLIGLATTVIVRMAVSSTDLAKAAPKAEVARGAALTVAVAILSENLRATAKLQKNASSLDKLEGPKDVAPEINVAPEIKPVSSVPIGLPSAQPKQPSRTTERIVTRHWHDPHDERRAAAQRATKGKSSARAQAAEASIDTGTKMLIGER